MRKPDFCKCENKDADQLRGNCEADQRLCFRCIDSAIRLHPINEISSLKPHTCDISLFRRELPIFCLFLRKSPYENFLTFLYILYISLFGISDLPTKIQEFPSLFNYSPYLEKKISLFVFWDVSHVCQAILCDCTARFVWDLVGNPENQFSHNEAQI